MAEEAGGLSLHSRYQVLTDGELAWSSDHKGTMYRFDGLRFSRRRLRDHGFSLVPSWQTPSYGWLRQSECPCAGWITAPAGGRSRAPEPFGGLAA